MKLIHSNISHVEIYLSCCNVLMVSLIQSAINMTNKIFKNTFLKMCAQYKKYQHTFTLAMTNLLS